MMLLCSQATSSASNSTNATTTDASESLNITYYHTNEYNALTVDAGNKKKAGASSTPMNAKEVWKIFV